MKGHSVYQSAINFKIINRVICTLVFILALVTGKPSIAFVSDYYDYKYDLGELIEYEENDLIDSNGNDVGKIISSVYLNNSIYTYVVEVTPSSTSGDVDIIEFNIGRLSGDPDIDPNYTGIYGYDFEEAKNAILKGSESPAMDESEIFTIKMDTDNTIDWNLSVLLYLFDDYNWVDDSTITFFYQHYSAPVEGFYNFSGDVYGTGDGFTPATVPIPGTLILLGSSLLGILSIGKKYKHKNP